MHWEFNSYSIPLLIAAFVAAVLAGYAWIRRSLPGAIPFLFLMLSVAVWSFGYGLEIAAPGFPLKLLSAKLQYLGIVGVPLFWWIYSVHFTGYSSWLSRRSRFFLALFPIATLLLAWTNEWHSLIWAEVEPNTRGPFHDITFTYGPWFWLNTFYSYLLMLSGTLLLIRFFIQSQGLFRRQVRTVLFAAFVPWLSNVAYLFGINPVPDLDLTPFAFTITGLLIAWGFFRLQFLDIVPLARHAIVEGMTDGVFVLDARNRIVDVNPSVRALFKGVSEFIGQPAGEIFAGYPDMIDRFREVKDAREVLTIQACGANIYFELRISPLYDQHGNFSGRLIVLQDITEQEQAKLDLIKAHDELEDRVQERTTELKAANQMLQIEVAARKQAEAALRASEAELRAMFTAMTDAVMVFDRRGRWIKIAPTNPSYSLLQGPAEHLIGKTLHEILPVEVADTILEQIHQALETQKTMSVDYSLKNNGQTLWFSGAISPIQDQQVILVAHDITDRKNFEEQLVYKTLHDVLTGLPNRRLFMERLELAFERVKRHPRRLIAVLFMDLDRFKVINDSLGHASGDKFLIAIAQKLRQSLRSVDTIARFGGDEFAILVDDIKDSSEAIRVAGRIQQELSSPFLVDGHEVFTSASIGIALTTHGYRYPEEILRDADAAMYRAKAEGRGRHEIFSAEMHAQNLALLQMETDLRLAIDNQQFQIYYQPIVDLASWKIVCVEALLRWQHPKLGMLLPKDFLALAEETRLISAIGEWVLRTVCSRGKRWHDLGHEKLRVAVNVSPRQFQELHLLDLIPGVLTETGLEPGFLALEICEESVMKDIDLAIRTLEELRHTGIHISIDDFGMGYSSLSYLKDFPAGSLKMDRSFLTDVTQNQNDASIASAIIAMAHTLQISVVAEGVETREQLEFLLEQKCDQAQGYLFSEPLTEKEITDLLQNGKIRLK
jgi:diguanylate cyclase (GGDEF)-like protein/PAS domain S-box-containing protein